MENLTLTDEMEEFGRLILDSCSGTEVKGSKVKRSCRDKRDKSVHTEKDLTCREVRQPQTEGGRDPQREEQS